jgi:uncharacterized phage infection (PIP) family protein YhgE
MAKKVAVPSLVGTTQDAAETALTAVELSVVKRYVSGDPDGTVYSQAPASGKVAKGDVVTIDILRAPAAPAPVDLSGVTKSIGELNKAVAELKASAAELSASVGELKASAAELSASVGELKSSAATKDEVGTLGKSIQELRDAVGKAATAAVQAAATRVQAQARESSADVGSVPRPPASDPPSPPAPAEKPAESASDKPSGEDGG